METKRAYAKRVTFTQPQQQIILDNYQNLSANQLLELLRESYPDHTFNDQSIYSFLRRVKREAAKSYQVLLDNNALEAAEKLKASISTLIPDKRTSTADAINNFLNKLIQE